MTKQNKKEVFFFVLLLALWIVVCSKKVTNPGDEDTKTVPHESIWGIYSLDLNSENVLLIAGLTRPLAGLRLSNSGTQFAFSQKIDGNTNEDEEICTINVDGSGFQRLTDNQYLDTYPAWSPDDSQIAFLSLRDSDLDIYRMNTLGTDVLKLYDSGFHDADIHWMDGMIVFTRNSQVWRLREDGTNPIQLSDPPNAGQWGNTNLPFGDYDPRLNPAGSMLVFERLEYDSSIHGNYNLFLVDTAGTGETRLTRTGYSQGLASWSYSGDRLVYAVAAINGSGVFDLYMINSDGTNNRNITPDYFPVNFLCHSPIFSQNDLKIYFIGEWWE